MKGSSAENTLSWKSKLLKTDSRWMALLQFNSMSSISGMVSYFQSLLGQYKYETNFRYYR